MQVDSTTLEEKTLPATATPPAIGQPWPGQGGVYAGITRGEDGQPDAHLVLCPTLPGKHMAWAAALDWAKAVENEGHTDYHVPTRSESALLYANLRDQLDQDNWHWTSTQYSAYDAFYQHFYDGDQYNNVKKFEAQVRAVRRFPL